MTHRTVMIWFILWKSVRIYADVLEDNYWVEASQPTEYK